MVRKSIMIFIVIILTMIAVQGAFAQTQIDLQNSACSGFKNADAQLNMVYKRIMDQYRDDPVFIDKLKKAERAWMKYRDAHIEALYPAENKAMEYGSMFVVCYCNAMEDMTRRRVDELKQWLTGVEEGDTCSGSRRIAQ